MFPVLKRQGLIGLLLLGGIALLVMDIPPVSLSWETASEVGAAGFHVYRSMGAEDAFVRVNPTLIPSRGDEMTGAAYRFADDDVVVGQRYVYRIEEVEWDGAVNPYPETVTVRAGLPRIWTKIEGGFLLGLSAFLFWRNRKH